MTTDKLILDPCCGSRMFWFDKENPLTLFGDRRTESHILCDGRALEIRPDVEMDFRAMPFEDETFYMVVFDPPHMVSLGANSWMAKKYGRLDKRTWREDIKQGFDECIRVLKTYGTLVFKWNESDIKIKDIVTIIGQQPIVGHVTGRHGKTIWMCFMKLPA